MSVKNRVEKLEGRTKNNNPTTIIDHCETEEEAVRRYKNETGRLVTGRLLFIKVTAEPTLST